MLTLPDGLLGRDLELEAFELTAEHIHAYAVATGDSALAAGPCRVAPLGFALTVRGAPAPDVELAAGTLSVHAGHAITAHRPLTAPGVYTVRARLAEVFEKSGRSGPLTVIVRRAAIHAADGILVATVDDRQIVRWRSAAVTSAPAERDRLGSIENPPPPDDRTQAPAKEAAGARDDGDLEVGALVGPERRRAPAPAAIAMYADSVSGRESLFVDQAFARSVGYDDVIVPGPLQSALLEAMLRRQLPGWTLHHLNLTFRISVITNEPIAMAAVVIERRQQTGHNALICDLSLENRHGERAALGTAELHQPAPLVR